MDIGAFRFFTVRKKPGGNGSIVFVKSFARIARSEYLLCFPCDKVLFGIIAGGLCGILAHKPNFRVKAVSRIGTVSIGVHFLHKEFCGNMTPDQGKLYLIRAQCLFQRNGEGVIAFYNIRTAVYNTDIGGDTVVYNSKFHSGGQIL